MPLTCNHAIYIFHNLHTLTSTAYFMKFPILINPLVKAKQLSFKW